MKAKKKKVPPMQKKKEANPNKNIMRIVRCEKYNYIVD